MLILGSEETMFSQITILGVPWLAAISNISFGNGSYRKEYIKKDRMKNKSKRHDFIKLLFLKWTLFQIEKGFKNYLLTNWNFVIFFSFLHKISKVFIFKDKLPKILRLGLVYECKFGGCSAIWYGETKCCFKGTFAGVRQFLTTENPLKMKKNTFYLFLKPYLVFKIFKFLSWKKNALIRKIRLVWKFMTSQSGKQTIAIHLLSNISRSEDNQAM